MFRYLEQSFNKLRLHQRKLMAGRPVQILSVKEDHTCVLNETALRNLLLCDDIKDRYVVVVSIAGTFRQGKSFLLNFFLRYMKFKYELKDSEGDWLGPDDVPLDGFSWRGGAEHVTTGIYMWHNIFRTETLTGEKVAIIFLDTQGAFDCNSTVRECATIFALSTLISSVQIYNLSQNIHEYDLQHLRYFTEYGRLVLDQTESIPFQKLHFLIRDWRFSYDNKYGLEGGKELLHFRLESASQHRDFQSLKQHIESCFSEISCFLMPHPGLTVANSPTFKGKLSDIDIEFKQNLRNLVPFLLAPENLVLKEVNGQKVKAADLVDLFNTYMKIFCSDKLPKMRSLFDATAEADNLIALHKAEEVYNNIMNEKCGAGENLNIAEVEAYHNEAMQTALNVFRNIKKMGGNSFSTEYEKRLKEKLQILFNEYKNLKVYKVHWRNVLLTHAVAMGSVIVGTLAGLSPVGVVISAVSVTSFFVVRLYSTLNARPILVAGASSSESSDITVTPNTNEIEINTDGQGDLTRTDEPGNRKPIWKLLTQQNLIWKDYIKPIWKRIKGLMSIRLPSFSNNRPHQS